MWRFLGKATISWRRAAALLSFDLGGAREGVLFTDGNGMSGTLSGLKSPDRPEVRNLWRVGETSGRRDRPFGRKEGARKKFSAEISRNPLKKLISRKEMESLSKHPQPIGPDGLVPVGSSMLDADRNDPEQEAYRIKAMQQVWDGYRCPPLAQMSFYVKIGECLRQRGIPCVVVIPPTQETVAQSVQSGPAAAEVAAWKRQLNTIFPHVIDLSFSSYDAATNFYRADPMHFKPDVGVRFMNAEVLPYATRVLRETPPPAAAP